MLTVILQLFYKSRKEKPIVFPSRTFLKMERNNFFREKDIRHYLMDNYISQVLVMGEKIKIDHELLVKIWGSKANAVPLLAAMI